MSLLTPEPGLVFWMSLSFGMVAFILMKYGFPVILQMVNKRKGYIDNALLAAKQAKERARIEADKIITDAQKQIEIEKESAVRAIRGEIASLSVSVAEKILREKLNSEEEQSKMINRLMDEVIISKS